MHVFHQIITHVPRKIPNLYVISLIGKLLHVLTQDICKAWQIEYNKIYKVNIMFCYIIKKKVVHRLRQLTIGAMLFMLTLTK